MKNKIDKKTILYFLERNKELLQQQFQINTLSLFGSFARDEATEHSNIDILVDMPSSFHAFFNLKYFLEKRLGRTVNLYMEKSLRSYIKQQIQNERIDIIISERTGSFIGILDNKIGKKDYKELR